MGDFLDNNVVNFEEDTQKDKYLTFSIGEEEFGIEIKYITEIIKFQSITDIPDVDEYITGVINLRGKIIPIMDMRLRFGKEFKEYHDRTCIIVVDVDDVTIGCIVDSVSEVAIIPEENVIDAPEVNNQRHMYIKNMGKTPTGIKLILDCEQLVRSEY